MLKLIGDRALRPVLSRQLRSTESVITLSPEVSIYLIRKLAEIPENQQAMRGAVAAFDAPSVYSGNASLQEDAVALALKAFSLAPGDRATIVETASDAETALARVPIHEDAVIEHDARVVPGFSFVGSDLTGRAVFRNGPDVLEVITANKRSLEEAFGVDLIYLNAAKQSVVMVQYKMLEPDRAQGSTDWLYYPDRQLAREMGRMNKFGQAHAAGPLDFRINPQVFYLRFVRRDAALGKSAITMPIDHYEVLRGDPACRGPRGSFRITYDTLGGRYLRQDGFLDLLSAGYIGAYAKVTSDLTTLINAALRNNRAVVVAVQARVGPHP